MIYPNLEEARDMAKEYDIIPLAYEMLIDTQTPINLFLTIKESSENCFLLESVDNGEQWGRYSFIGFNPRAEIKVKNNTVIYMDSNGIEKITTGDPFEYISKLLDDYKSPKIKNMPKLTGGLVGYFAYDAVRYIEKKLCNPPKDDLELPDCHFMLCDEIIAFDHLKHKVIVIVNVFTKVNFNVNYHAGVERIHELAEQIKKPASISVKSKTIVNSEVKSNVTKDEFIENVKKAKEYIKNGDVFQVVLSQRFEVENAPEAFDVYRLLRSINPSPYMYYFKFKDYSVAGASPEMLVSVEGRNLFTRPIAGTVKRGKDEREDKELENLLISDKKEQAEHTMLVDLGRNDVGKVSAFGSVEVTHFMRVEKYSQVMHLVSDVKGELRPEKTSLDALKAILPAGTLSGAPKVRAMQIIDEIEKEKRGLYGGTAGYITFNGDLDTCIAIRTVLFKNRKAYVQAGAGIVTDSIPEKEYEETENKAKAMIKAIMEARDL